MGRVADEAARLGWMGISPTAIGSRSMANVWRKLGPSTGHLVHEATASSSAHGLSRERFSQPDVSRGTWPVHIDRALEMQAPTSLRPMMISRMVYWRCIFQNRETSYS